MADLQGKVIAVCTSPKKGTAKTNIGSGHLITDHGIEGDAHAGNWHRQVSLLSYESIKEFNERGGQAEIGAFGENLVVEGIELNSLPVGSIFTVGSAKLRMTQIGKECHSHCAIYHRVGDCIMPRMGIFAEVIQEGYVSAGDDFFVDYPSSDREFTAAVITISDKGFRGERVDESGPVAKEMLIDAGYRVVETVLVADEIEDIKRELIRLADGRQVDLIITSGGTGFSKRDVTPEATLEISEKQAPGIAEYMRMKSMEITPRGMLSRGVAVIRGGSLIINLPGSPKAVRENLAFIIGPIEHGLKILRGSASECGSR